MAFYSISSVIGYDWMVCEILTRLPVKSLFRFKSVSKRLCSLIQHDEHFIDIHLTHSKTRPPCRLFMVVPLPDDDYVMEQLEIDTWPQKEFFITADIMFEDKQSLVVVDTARMMDSSSFFYNLISKPINGLICLIDSQCQYVVRICNISTGEVSPWIEPIHIVVKIDEHGKLCYSLDERIMSCTYGFGFDPASNEHKLVCVWKILSSQDVRFYCYVLTIGRQGYNGNNTWRRIDECAPYDLPDDSVYVNGFIYWSTFALMHGVWGSKFRPSCIVAFNVRSEKFKTITIPDFILDFPPDPYETVNYVRNPYSSGDGRVVDLFEVDGHLCMCTKMNDKIYQIYMYKDDHRSGNWSEVCSITIPFELTKCQRVKFHTFVGSNDKVILTLCDGYACQYEVREKCAFFYCYNWTKRSWTEFEVSGMPSSVPHLCADNFFTTFSESLLPP